jgi:HK97 family phage major capsid protein
MKFRAAVKGSVGELYLYDEIGAWGISARDVISTLDDLAARGAKSLDIRIHSPGGDVFDGIAIREAIRRWSGAKHVYIDGLAASIASVIAMVGDKISMSSGSMLMVHDPWGGAVGSDKELHQAAEVLSKIRETIIDSYSRCGKSREEISALMAAETWFTADEAVAAGFADEVLPGEVETEQSSKAWAMSKFRNAPARAFALAAKRPYTPADDLRVTPPRAEKEAAMDPEEIKKIEARVKAEFEAKARAEQDAREKAALEAKVSALESQLVTLANSVKSDPSASLVDGARQPVSRFAPTSGRVSLKIEAREDRSERSAMERAKALAKGGDRHVAAIAQVVSESLSMGRVAAAVIHAEMNRGMSHAEAAWDLGYHKMADQLAPKNSGMLAGDASKGGVTVPTDVQSGFIDALSAAVVVRSQIPPGNVIKSDRETLQYPRFTSAYSVESVGEASAGSTGEQSLSTDSISLRGRKQRIEALVSRQLLRSSAVDIDQVIMAKLALAAALKEDYLLVLGLDSANEPRGLKTISGAALAAATATPSYSDARTDLRKLLKQLAVNNVPAAMGRAFIGSEVSRWGLGDLADSQSAYPFDQQLQSDRLMGIPAAFSNQLDSTGGAASCFYCWAPGCAVFFEHLAQMIEMSDTYTTAAGLCKSASGSDNSVIRLWRSFDFNLTHDEAVEHLSTVPWGV